MSDLENMNEMQRSCSRIEEQSHQNEREISVHLESNELQQKVYPMNEDFQSLLNMNRRENGEITIDILERLISR